MSTVALKATLQYRYWKNVDYPTYTSKLIINLLNTDNRDILGKVFNFLDLVDVHSFLFAYEEEKAKVLERYSDVQRVIKFIQKYIHNTLNVNEFVDDILITNTCFISGSAMLQCLLGIDKNNNKWKEWERFRS